MAFIFEDMRGACIVLSMIYFAFCMYIYRKLLWLHANTSPGLNIRKLFVMTCLLIAVLRIMSFSSMTVLEILNLNLANEDNNNEHDHTTRTKAERQHEKDVDLQNGIFFEKVLLVLFDFPQFCCISAYVLLLVLWAEAYVKSRRHWLSSLDFRRSFVLAYLIMNTLLYAIQLTIYSLLFLPSINPNLELSMIYLTLASVNIGLPFFWFCIYIYMALRFSGFPKTTDPVALRRLRILSRLGALWSFARLAWSTVAMTSVFEHWISELRKSDDIYSFGLVTIFIVTEILPIYFSVQSSTLTALVQTGLGEKDFLTGKYNIGNRLRKHVRNNPSLAFASGFSVDNLDLKTDDSDFEIYDEDSNGNLSSNLSSGNFSNANSSTYGTNMHNDISDNKSHSRHGNSNNSMASESQIEFNDDYNCDEAAPLIFHSILGTRSTSSSIDEGVHSDSRR